MKRNILFFPILMMGVFLLMTVGCNKDDNNYAAILPVLTTTEVSQITTNSAISGGVIFSDGGSPVIASGVCWSSDTTQQPTIANDTTVDLFSEDSFISNITNLIPYTKYLVRAYATNANGTAYGGLWVFTTGKGVPVLTTNNVTSIWVTTAVSGGNIIYNGGDTIITSGICWGTNELPTITDSITADTNKVAFVHTMTNLSGNAIYYMRAYATNINGTGYGDVISFRTQQGGEKINFTTVDIPAGTFTMGSPESEAYRNSNETQHQVTLSAFKMSKYEITNAQYAEFLNAKSIGSTGKYTEGAYPSQTLIYECSDDFNWGLKYSNGQWEYDSNYENHPVVLVTWYGAMEFANYVGGRLPTEAQWEFACRANTAEPFSTGTCLNFLEANYNWVYAYGSCINSNTNLPGATQSVGTYSANDFGLFNMHGNVGEWCSDLYDEYVTTAQTNPTGSESGSTHIVRGGSWNESAVYCRSASRASFRTDGSDYSVGFRVVMEP